MASNKLEVDTQPGNPYVKRLTLNGQEVGGVVAYRIEQRAEQLPVVTLEFECLDVVFKEVNK